jgi:hypothetical protein
MSFLQELNDTVSRGTPESRLKALWQATDMLIAGHLQTGLTLMQCPRPGWPKSSLPVPVKNPALIGSLTVQSTNGRAMSGRK